MNSQAEISSQQLRMMSRCCPV